MKKIFVAILFAWVFFVVTNDLSAWVFNNPHDESNFENARFSAFSSPPKTLDPARAYSSDEMVFIEQIYEPPIQYHYLKRPYTLIPLTAESMPEITYFDKSHRKLSPPIDYAKVSYTLYDIKIKPKIMYQEHPCFAKNNKGSFVYHGLKVSDLDDIEGLEDFKEKGTRELTAYDYAYQIKRLAHPKTSSPIYGIMTGYIEGLSELADKLKEEQNNLEQNKDFFLDLRKFDLSGVKVLSRYHYQIKVKGIYAQFIYWLAMPFFSPMPWEADLFHSQEDMDEKNLTLDWYPIGTGPYLMEKNNPNKEMVLARNKHFHPEYYPEEGEKGDLEKGFLEDAGKKIPFIDRFIFSLDKESIPRWNKFLQGYYDKSGITADSFDQAIKIDKNGDPILTEEFSRKGIRLQTTVSPSVYYMGFNMLDDVVGGQSERARKLRQAISVALDYEEYISIFMNGRGVSAQSPIPPGIFGYKKGQEGLNPYVFKWDSEKNRVKRRSLEDAKLLMKEAGYVDGIDPNTKQLLILNYDVTASGSPGDQSRLNWMRKQYAKIGIQLNIRSTQYNRFREKVRTGNAQIFSWGWLADYPDPENFLFLLYGPSGKVKFGGENAANYSNKEFDQLFEVVKNLPNGSKRQALIDEMLEILRRDSPWLWGFHTIDFTLSHHWNRASKPHAMARNVFKFERIDTKKRAVLRNYWNNAQVFPLVLLLLGIFGISFPLVKVYRKRENTSTIKRL